MEGRGERVCGGADARLEIPFTARCRAVGLSHRLASAALRGVAATTALFIPAPPALLPSQPHRSPPS
jgi:hypothetical protein